MITNIEKDWITTQMHSNTKEKWETPQYSKSQINKAGKIISDNSSSDKEKSDEEKKEAIIILNNWRASHAYPLQVIASNLRINNKDAIVVQRLKRLDSIIGKLKRFPEISLYGMQDLGGCRVITNTISEVYEALNRYKSSRIRHEVKREDDYIKYPKASGYRGYHAVFLFHSDKNEVYNKNMRIEVQFRTTLQHTWATAVEVMGIYTKTALKASMGDIDTLRFFVLASSVFAQIEKSPIVPGTSEDYSSLIKEIRDIDRHQNIVSRLSALSTAISHISKKSQTKSNDYYVLILNYTKKTLRIYPYTSKQIEDATTLYSKIEASRNPDIDAVLVSATSFETLKAAYPNYFVDISNFVLIMRKVLEDN